MERPFYHTVAQGLVASAVPRPRIPGGPWIECRWRRRKRTGIIHSKEGWDAARANYLGRGAYRGTKAKDCRACHGCIDRGRKGETREHSRLVSRRSGDQLCRGRRPRGGSETGSMKYTSKSSKRKGELLSGNPRRTRPLGPGTCNLRFSYERRGESFSNPRNNLRRQPAG